jgi:two-component system OmpR family response regulator
VKVLLVEDNEKLGRLTAESLRLHGHIVELVSTAESALYLVQVEPYDVIVLDRMLPNGQDGLEVCARLRAQGIATPVLILTALGGVARRLEGFEQGADDYLAKPFDMRELVARVTAIARRPKEIPAHVIIDAGRTSINLSRRRVTTQDLEVHLSKRLWALLEYLALHRGQTIAKDTLIYHVWGVESEVLENSVEAAIRKLRQRLGDEKGEVIQTVHGFGYRLKV